MLCYFYTSLKDNLANLLQSSPNLYHNHSQTADMKDENKQNIKDGRVERIKVRTRKRMRKIRISPFRK